MGTLNIGDNLMSRVTIASMEDMFYIVDYTAAYPFGQEDLDASCTYRRRRSLHEHGEDSPLKNSQEKNTTRTLEGRKMLSEALRN